MNEQDDEPGTRGGFARLGQAMKDLQARLRQGLSRSHTVLQRRPPPRGATLIRAFITCLKQEPDSEETVASQAGQGPGCGKILSLLLRPLIKGTRTLKPGAVGSDPGGPSTLEPLPIPVPLLIPHPPQLWLLAESRPLSWRVGRVETQHSGSLVPCLPPPLPRQWSTCQFILQTWRKSRQPRGHG